MSKATELRAQGEVTESGKVQTAKHTPGPWRTGDRFKTVFGPPNEQWEIMARAEQAIRKATRE